MNLKKNKKKEIKEDSKNNSLEILKVMLGPFETNSYILYNRRKNEVLLIDVPYDTEVGIEPLKKILEGKKVIAVLYTHNHFDHIAGGYKIRAKQYMNEKDIKTITEQIGFAKRFGIDNLRIPLCQPFEKIDSKLLRNFGLKIIETPGHSEGSTSFYLINENILFSGDTLFKDGFGRTDLKYGSEKELINSITKIQKIINNETKIYPGHGESFEGKSLLKNAFELSLVNDTKILN